AWRRPPLPVCRLHWRAPAAAASSSHPQPHGTPMTSSRKLVVSMFSGGRGTATITRELVRDPRIQLNLLVNAYDDGLSTGELRNFIPGMLGPSDFRKNFSYILDLYSEQQFALEKLIEYRLPQD